MLRRFARQFFKALSTVFAGVAIGVIAAALQAAIEALVGWRNQALQLFFDRNLLQALGIHHRGLHPSYGYTCLRPKAQGQH